jgi:hypothetical protein
MRPAKPRISAEDRFNEFLSRKHPYVIRVVQNRYRMMDSAIIEEGVQEASFQFWKLLKSRRQLHQAEKHIGLLVTMAKQESVRLARSHNSLASLNQLTKDPAPREADRPDFQFYMAECDGLRGRLFPLIANALEPELLETLKQFAFEAGCSLPEDVVDFISAFLFRRDLPGPTPRMALMQTLCSKLHKRRNTVDKALSRARQRYLSAIAAARVAA